MAAQVFLCTPVRSQCLRENRYVSSETQKWKRRKILLPVMTKHQTVAGQYQREGSPGRPLGCPDRLGFHWPVSEVPTWEPLSEKEYHNEKESRSGSQTPSPGGNARLEAYLRRRNTRYLISETRVSPRPYLLAYRSGSIDTQHTARGLLLGCCEDGISRYNFRVQQS